MVSSSIFAMPNLEQSDSLRKIVLFTIIIVVVVVICNWTSRHKTISTPFALEIISNSSSSFGNVTTGT